MTSPVRLLLIEDNPVVGAQVRDLLSTEGEVTWVQNGEDGVAQFTSSAFDVVLLDLTLPVMDGIDVCRHLRAQDMLTPILMLSGRTSIDEIVGGFDAGADEYVTKPFVTDELAARVRRLVRRRQAMRDTCNPQVAPPVCRTLHCGAFVIEIDQHRVLLAGERLALTPKEFELLLLLAQHPGRAFTRGELLQTVWGSAFDGYDHTINTHINRLRGKIEADPGHPVCIETVWGVGYRFAEAPDLVQALA